MEEVAGDHGGGQGTRPPTVSSLFPLPLNHFIYPHVHLMPTYPEQALTGMANMSLADRISGSASGGSRSSSGIDKSQPPPPSAPPSSASTTGGAGTGPAAAGVGVGAGAGVAVGLEELGGMSPFEFFLEEVESEEDVYLRLHAYRRIRVVAQALGPVQTERMLLPFLEGRREGGMDGGRER